MAPVIAAAVAQGAPLALHEALSGVFGSISLAAWIFLLVRSFTVYPHSLHGSLKLVLSSE